MASDGRDPISRIQKKWNIPRDVPISKSQPKPVSVWLALGSVVPGIVLYLLPKTPPVVLLCCVAIFGLLFHPAIHLWWIEDAPYRRIGSVVILMLGCMGIGYIAWPKPAPVADGVRPCIPDTVTFVPPKDHKLVRYDDTFTVPSYVMCPPHGMTEEARIGCLCPSRLPYALKALPAPKDGNYETEITVTKTCTHLFKVRLFFRDVYSVAGSIFSASPYIGKTPGVILARGLFEDDKWSVAMTSTAPEDSFTTSLITSTGLRVLCVNQEN
jgi:hypothetical protein